MFFGTSHREEYTAALSESRRKKYSIAAATILTTYYYRLLVAQILGQHVCRSELVAVNSSLPTARYGGLPTLFVAL